MEANEKKPELALYIKRIPARDGLEPSIEIRLCTVGGQPGALYPRTGYAGDIQLMDGELGIHSFFSDINHRYLPGDLCYKAPMFVDEHKAMAMVKTLVKINKALAKLDEALGHASTLAETMVRLALALKIKRVFLLMDGDWRVETVSAARGMLEQAERTEQDRCKAA